MTKTTFWGLRVSEPLDKLARMEAERRGMNLSEFVRYALNSFFDLRPDYATNPGGQDSNRQDAP